MPASIQQPPKVFRPRVAIPSLLDRWLVGDAWVAQCTSGRCLVLYLNNQPVRLLAGLPLDQPTLNARLFEIRSRPPRPGRTFRIP